MSTHGPIPRQGFGITRGENTSELCMLKVASTFPKLPYLLVEIPTCVLAHTQMIQVKFACVAEQGGGGRPTRTHNAKNAATSDQRPAARPEPATAVDSQCTRLGDQPPSATMVPTRCGGKKIAFYEKEVSSCSSTVGSRT